jgi:hypothetical protein
MTTLAPEPTTATGAGGPAITHWVCNCDPDTALCGVDVAGEDWMGDDEVPTCVVCNDLMDPDCPRCG